MGAVGEIQRANEPSKAVYFLQVLDDDVCNLSIIKGGCTLMFGLMTNRQIVNRINKAV